MAYFDSTCHRCGLGLPSELTITEADERITCPFCSPEVSDSDPETRRHLRLYYTKIEKF